MFRSSILPKSAFAVLTLAAGLFLQGDVLGQPATIRLNVEQRAEGGGSAEYRFNVNAFGLFFGPAQGQMVAPDGTIFERFDASVSGLDFSTLGNRFFGDWSILETTSSGLVTHNFTFDAFELSDVFSETPTITTPTLSGQSVVVGDRFDLEWEFASGAVPSGKGATWSGDGSGDITFQNFSGNSVEALVTFSPGFDEAMFTVSAGSVDSLSPFFSEVDFDPSGLGSSWTVDGAFWNLAQPITVTATAVPEPNTAIGLCFTTALVTLRRKRSHR